MPTQIDLDATGSKLNFDSNTFVIDESTNRVGIGANTPVASLHIDNSFGSLGTGIAFGDGDTGIYENTDDDLRIQIGGGLKAYFTAADFRLSAGYNFTLGGNSELGWAGSGGVKIHSPSSGNLQLTGNIGIGVTPETDWDSDSDGYRVLQIGVGGVLFGRTSAADGDKVGVMAGLKKTTGGWEYFNDSSDFASSYTQSGGIHAFNTAPSGADGATVTLTNIMNITDKSIVLKQVDNDYAHTSYPDACQIWVDDTSNGRLMFTDDQGNKFTVDVTAV